MRKLIAIIGVPGTGKSTVMKEFMKSYEWETDKPIDLVESHITQTENGTVRIIGKYEEGETFSGTDRLSMAVQPKFLEFLDQSEDAVVMFEGDRLTSNQVFKTAQGLGYDLQIIHLEVSNSERQRRYEERGSEQDEKFIRGRMTKVANVVDCFGPNPLFGESGQVVDFLHETPEHTKVLVEQLHQEIA